MWRILRLLTNLVLSSFIFNYYLTILVVILNSFDKVSSHDFLIIFLDIYVFYGPFWILLLLIVFYLIQFFSDKKINIGIMTPPSLTYFLFFSIFVSSFVLYLNYDYYFVQFSKSIQAVFIKILLTNLIFIILSVFFVFSKTFNKKWFHIVIIISILISLLNTYYTVVTDGTINQSYLPDKIDKYAEEPRKVRIVIMNGLSLGIINSLRSEQNLMNFNYLLKNGVSGNMNLFKPNLDVSLLNTALTGKPPAKLPYHSNLKFKFRNIATEFNVFPRYIFFRYSSNLKFSFFYKTKLKIINQIGNYYERNGYKTQDLIAPDYVPSYFSKNLKTNTKYIKHFSEISKNPNDTKYDILKKSIFYDNYIKNRIINLKDKDYYFSVIQFNGLDMISKYFYQYYMNHIFGNINKLEVKKYKWVLGKYYEFYDSIIGNLITTTGDDELLVILSLYEYEPLPVWRRLLANILGNRDIYVYKSLNSKGTIFFYEKSAIKKGYPLQNMSILDFFPTVLYYTKFDLLKNLNGKIIRKIFLDNFLLNNPIDIRTKNILN